MSAAVIDSLERSTIRAAGARIVPLLIFAFIISFLDRVNVGFAAISANKDLGLTATMYGFGAGLSFIGYSAFELPSNLALERFGARRWLARIMVTWGLIGCAMAWVHSPMSFYVVRFLIGAAEAGLFPGAILYLTYWFPRRYRAGYIGLFALGSPLANVLGAPISGALLNLNGFFGMKGWQWLYLLEASPAVILGLIIWAALPDRPAEAHWLSDDQKAWLAGELAKEQNAGAHKNPLAMILDGKVLFLSAVFFLTGGASYALSLWLPQIIKGLGFSNIATGFLSATPFLFGCIAMLLAGAWSDRSRERIWSTIHPNLLTFLGLMIGGLAPTPALQFFGVCLAAAGFFAAKGPFLALISESFSDSTAAAGIALVSTLGSLSGFFAPSMVGWMKDHFHNYSLAFVGLAIQPLIGAALLLAFHKRVLGKTGP